MNEIDESAVASRILVVDDNIENLDLLERMLVDFRYKIVSVQSGKEAIDACEIEPPDLVLLDIDLPDMSGYEVCKHIKSNHALKNIPIIFVSGFSDTKEKVKAFKCGGVDYLTKPFNGEELHSRVKTHLELKHNRQTIAIYVDQLQATIADMSALFETGSLVASVVHDTKKFISAMIMLLESMIIPRLNENLDQSEDWVKEVLFDISEVHSNSIHCMDFLESLLSINRKNEEVVPVNIHKTIHQAINLVSHGMMQEGILWEIESDEENQLMVMGNGQLVRVFMNLIVNAMDVLKKREISNPKIILKIEDMENTVQVYVIDNGPGINEDVLTGIRKGMILSTKGKGGNGFGISGLTKIVKSLNGTINIESEVGKGAAFIITLQKFVDLVDLDL
ncbi:MAG: hybrid sensor histidine kinase/response regulator [Desulfobacteraceae bacterium]|nr:hybrid sensor histidine kinase/response regulator [Desulfobacteraceae bacterium]